MKYSSNVWVQEFRPQSLPANSSSYRHGPPSQRCTSFPPKNFTNTHFPLLCLSLLNPAGRFISPNTVIIHQLLERVLENLTPDQLWASYAHSGEDPFWEQKPIHNGEAFVNNRMIILIMYEFSLELHGWNEWN